MQKNETRANLKVVKNDNGLEVLHDDIMARLESPVKMGIRELLLKNNSSLKQTLYPKIKECGVRDVAKLMVALDWVLDVHAKECYTIGYLDCMKGRN